MKRLKEETDLAPLCPVLVFRPLLPRSRLQLQQIKRESIVRTLYEENVAGKASYERSERVGRRGENRRNVNLLSTKSVHPESGGEYSPPYQTPSSLSSSCALNDVPRQVQRRGFPVRWKVRRLNSRSWRRILPINVFPFFLSLSFFLFLRRDRFSSSRDGNEQKVLAGMTEFRLS